MKESVRSQRVVSLLQKDLNDIFYQYMKPILGNVLVTVTFIELSADLGIAKVYLSILGKEEKDILEKIEENKSYIRKNLGNKIANKVRRVPELRFYWDNSIDRSYHINKILKDIGEEDELK